MNTSSALTRSVIAATLLSLAGATALAQERPARSAWVGSEPLDTASLEQRAVERALAIDADGDGVITAAELVAHREARRLEHMQRRLQRLDSNGDGVVSVEEYQAAQLERIAALDADGDGEVSREELRAAHRAMRDEGGRGHRGRNGH